MVGLVIQGSNGEAPHLLHSERQTVISTALEVLKQHGKPEAVIIAGCGVQSTRETLQLCREAEAAGAHYALVLSPSYWGAFISPNNLKLCEFESERGKYSGCDEKRHYLGVL